MSALGRRLFALGVTSMSLVACSAIWGFDDLRRAGPNEDGGPGADAEGGLPENHDAVGDTTASKVDVLLVVDNSASMGDKQAILAQSLGALLSKVAESGDVHLGVISSSLGSFGFGPFPPPCAKTGRSNDAAHLLGAGKGGPLVTGLTKEGFLAFKAGDDFTAFATAASQLVEGVDQTGCGFEAQLESMYRFLSAPDPWSDVTIDKLIPTYSGVDSTVIAQRAAFLRPDSLVVVVMLTDEDDSFVDPFAYGGLGWAFAAESFPNSTQTRPDNKSYTGPRATSACASNPGDPECTSCVCDDADPGCARIKADAECKKTNGYYDRTEDFLNARFQHMKRRYGRDPQYPIERYVNALTKVRVPKRDEEHRQTIDGDKRRFSDYESNAASCTNPLFAKTLPTSSTEDLCNLEIGRRDKDLVVFALIGGVPETLLSNGTPTSWEAVIGRNPAAYDETNLDAHMIQSVTPRASLPPPSTTRGDPGPDGVHGREWDTGGDDLQYACTFDLPTQRTCTASDPSCDCAGSKNPPVCGPTAGDQMRGKAYPSPRQLRVAHALGTRAIVGSVCSKANPLTYAPTLDVLAARIAPRIKK